MSTRSGGLDFLGLTAGSEKVLSMPSQEELQIARYTRALLNSR